MREVHTMHSLGYSCDLLLSLRRAGPLLTPCICVRINSLITTRVRIRGCRGGRRRRPVSTYTDIEGTGIAIISGNRPVHSSVDHPEPEYLRQAPNIVPVRVLAHVRPQRHVHQPTKRLVCGTLNVHSLPRKLEALKQLASVLDIPVLCLTETWLDEDYGRRATRFWSALDLDFLRPTL